MLGTGRAVTQPNLPLPTSTADWDFTLGDLGSFSTAALSVCFQICHIFHLIRKGSRVFAHVCARRDCPGGLKVKWS